MKSGIQSELKRPHWTRLIPAPVLKDDLREMFVLDDYFQGLTEGCHFKFDRRKVRTWHYIRVS